MSEDSTYYILDRQPHPNGAIEIRFYPQNEYQFTVMMVRSDMEERQLGLRSTDYHPAKMLFRALNKCIAFLFTEE